MNMSSPLIVTLIAPPGGGKGTQSEFLSKAFDIPHLSTGAMLRAKQNDKDALGLIIAEIMDKKQFAPDDVMIKMIRERTAQEDCQGGYVLDGFPRTLKQVQMLEELLAERDHDVIAIQLQVDEEVLADRILGRITCKNCEAIYNEKNHMPLVENICDVCNQKALYVRPEDTREALQQRLHDYHLKTEKTLDLYRQSGRLLTVNGNGTPEEVAGRIQALIL